MRPLTLDDLLPLNEYAGQRREFLAAHHRYVDRYRRVRVGPLLTLLFENRQTLWFRIQEVLRVARLGDTAKVQRELDVYNRLLPTRDCLQAAVLIDIRDETRVIEELAFWQQLGSEDLRLRLGETIYPAQIVTCRPEDRCIGAAHWMQLPLDADGRGLLADFRTAARFEVVSAVYQHEGPLLNDEVRQSLVDDLELSSRDAA
jgi:hypothetical protein